MDYFSSANTTVSGYFMATNTMIKKLISLLTIFTLTTSCNSGGKKNILQSLDTVKTVQKELTKTEESKFDTTEIICDSIYKDKGYKLIKTTFFNSKSYDEDDFNAIFLFYKLKNGKYEEIYRDSILSQFEDIKFEDFNNDNVKDILIENISDVRSNLTYYL